MKKMRTGVLYPDGSITIVREQEKTDEIEECLSLLNGNETAKLVDVYLAATDVRERL